MDLRESVAGNVTILEVAGRIDSTTAPTFSTRLMAAVNAPQNRVVIDLKQVQYISSAGFRVLLIASKRTEEANGRLALCGMSGEVRRLFDIAAFTDLFTILASRAEALAAVGTAGG